MAQLRDSVIDGSLEVTGDIVLKTNEKAIKGIHPDTGETNRLIYMSGNGNTVVGYDGYVNENGNSHIYGNDVYHYIGSVGKVNYKPYYRAGDTIKFTNNSTYIRTAGYVTNAMKDVVFTIPLSKPIIGAPTAQVSESEGLILRQNNTYTHGSAASTYAKPTSYDVFVNPDVGLVVTAHFDVTTNAINNNPIGVYWNGVITLS